MYREFCCPIFYQLNCHNKVEHFSLAIYELKLLILNLNVVKQAYSWGFILKGSSLNGNFGKLSVSKCGVLIS